MGQQKDPVFLSQELITSTSFRQWSTEEGAPAEVLCMLHRYGQWSEVQRSETQARSLFPLCDHLRSSVFLGTASLSPPPTRLKAPQRLPSRSDRLGHRSFHRWD